MGKGVNVRLVMIDLRRDAIEDAKRFAREEGVEAEAYVANALEAHKLGKYDIVFNVWSYTSPLQ